MLDIKRIKENPEYAKERLATRQKDYSADIDRLIELDAERRALIADTEAKKAEQNKISKQIPLFKKEGKDVAPIFAEMKVLSETVTYIIGFVTMYFLTLILATFLISIPGEGNLVTNLTATLSCISNVGPGLDSVGPVFTYHFYDGFSKFILSMVMIAGRLELSTFFIIFSRFFWDPNRV